MGEAKKRASKGQMLLPYVLNGQLQAVPGSRLDGKSAEVLAAFAAGENNVTAIMDELLSGRIVQLSGVRQSTIVSVEDWLSSRSGIGAKLLAELRRAHDDPNRGAQIYPMTFSDDIALELDRLFFEANPNRCLRLRPLVGNERGIGELNPGWTDRVVSIMVDRGGGIRSRFFFGCPQESSDANIEQDDLQITRLALRYAKSKTVLAI
jgi:hypothetical protein